MDVPEKRTDNDKTLRVSDADRDEVVRQLNEHAGVGRLTLAEHEERISQAIEAKTRGELDVLLTDLPATETTAEQPVRRRKVTRWLLSVMSGTERTGRWRVGERLNSITVMGGCEIDLRNAELDGNEVTISAFSIMGGTDIYVPDTVDLEVTGFSLMGGRAEKGSMKPPRPGAPRVTIRSFNFMGGSDIHRLPEETNGLPGGRASRELRREQRRNRRHLEH